MDLRASGLVYKESGELAYFDLDLVHFYSFLAVYKVAYLHAISNFQQQRRFVTCSFVVVSGKHCSLFVFCDFETGAVIMNCC